MDGPVVEDELTLSMIVGAFGDPLSLRTCLSSLLDQTRPLEEIIVVDNTTDNDTAAKNREMTRMDSRIRYEWTAHWTAIPAPYVSRHSRCLYTATEIGVEMAKGDWIGFPNQDSYYCRSFVERMMSATQGAEFIYCDIILGRFDRVYAPRSCTPASCNIDKTNFIMRREWFTGFKDKWTSYELADGFMVDELVRRGIKCAKVPEVLCVHN